MFLKKEIFVLSYLSFKTKENKNMKKLLIFTFSFILAVSVYAQSDKTEIANEVVGPKFEWNKKNHDFGKIPQNKPVTAVFKFTNEGDAALVITRAKGSCGCTVPKYPTAPIHPGQSGEIRAIFNAKTMGNFNKTVTVTSNAGSDIILRITGEVVK